MHCAVIEFAQGVVGLTDADTAEDNPETANPVINAMAGYESGPMRLGARECTLRKGSRIREAYGTEEISERHRHRYKFNEAYTELFSKAGMMVTATSEDGEIVEAVEIPSHPWFVGVQFHPEYKSNVKNPHPLFVAFVGQAMESKIKG
jgi:CTP synthase